MDARQHAPATARNREPILGALRGLLREGAVVLEIASGTGEHAAYFSAAIPGTSWQPSERDPARLASIDAWGASTTGARVRRGVALDVTAVEWPVGAFDAVFNANMIHIAPWGTALGLLGGAARHLVIGGALIVYGPFRIAGEHTAASNAAFDAELRRQDGSWGIRDLEAFAEAGEHLGFALEQRIEMPANNQLLVLRLGTRAVPRPP